MSGMIKPLTIRLGYVAMSLMLENASPSQTIKVKNLQKMLNKQAAIESSLSLYSTFNSCQKYRCRQKLLLPI
ncbi:hypothetical protein [Halalkalibacter nanhaiisediminis]|uniref:Uncharacterized protein n=1 Tax=Halalkalibacter nanhaiisediminis TaxID=688079 RepID=A0A562QGK9_9BACI|nr:hypothetical protein [Halalkalibacter nanhaiisediminis]TWI55803.1 hypothetical protein IQ10_02363 [Halalkalibacter nanhaiisediminis]